MYVGESSRSYSRTIDVGLASTIGTVADLLEGKHYFFAVTAINSSGLESAFSDEVEYTVPSILNALPTLDALGSIVMNQDDSTRTVTLSGITSGSAAENQGLSVAASSSNPALISAPTVYYLSPNSTGVLRFKPAAGASGTAVITVTVSDGIAVSTRSFTVTVNPLLPQVTALLDPIQNIVVAQNSGTRSLALTGIGTDVVNPLLSLAVSASSSNPSLIPTPSVSYNGGNSGTLSFTPAGNSSGTATITAVVQVGGLLGVSVSRSFTVTVNNPPTLDGLANLNIDRDAATQTVTLGGITPGGANETQSLEVTAISSNPNIVPAPTVYYLSPNSTGVLRFKPAPGATGSAVITVSVSDGQPGNSTTSRSFTVTVSAPSNVAPTLDAIANLAVDQNSATRQVSLTGISSGSATEAQPLSLTCSSSNPGLIPTPALNYASPNSSGTLSFTPAADTSGTATVTVTVSDGEATTSRAFTVTVNAPPNAAPTLDALPDLVLTQNAGSRQVPLTGISSGASYEKQLLTFGAFSSNPALVPAPVVNYASPATTGTLVFTPAANVSGSATISVTLYDGQSLNGSITRTFKVTVNNPPTLDPLANMAIMQDAPTQTVPLSGIGAGGTGESQMLQVSAVSSNPALIPAPVVSYSFPNSSGALSFTPARGGTGTAVITVTVTDGQLANNSVSRSFAVNVDQAPNVAPTLDPITDLLVAQNAGSRQVPLSGISSGSPSESQPITISATSSNPALIPNPVVNYSSPSSVGSLTFTPAANVSGTAILTVTVFDGQSSNSTIARSFRVTVNSAPTLAAIGNISVNQDSSVQTIPLSGISAGGVNENQPLQVTASSSNPSVVPAPSVAYTSPSTTGLLSFAPVRGAVGSASITVTVNDGQPGNNAVSRTFIVTVNSVINAAPTVDPVADLLVAQNSGTRQLTLTGISSGSANESQPITVSASSSNPALVPAPVVSYSSPSSTGVLSFAPTAQGAGVVVITVTVSDGQSLNGTTSRSFKVTVNNAPTLNPLPDLTLTQGASEQSITLSGITSGAANESQPLQVTAVVSNTALIPALAVSYASPSTGGLLRFTPASGVTGSALVSVTVNDGQPGNSSITRSFTVTVNAAPNAAPTLDAISDLAISQNAGSVQVPLTGVSSGASYERQLLTFSASSSNPALIPAPVIYYASPASSGTLVFVPAANTSGTAMITVTLFDGQVANGRTTRSFRVAVNNTPTLNTLSDLNIIQDATTQTTILGGISSGSANELQTLEVTARSSNPSLIPDPAVYYLSPNSTGVLRFRPTAGASGTSVITVAVIDGQAGNGVVTRSFTVTVSPPKLSALATASASDDSSSPSLGAVISGLQVSSSDARTLILSWQTDRPATSFVEYGETELLESMSALSEGTNHTAALTDLSPNTSYYLRVQSLDAENHSVATEVNSVATPAATMRVWPAESADLTAPMSVAGDSAAIGSAFVTCSSSNAGTATFNVDFPEGLAYVIWCRVKAPAGGGSFRVSVDGSAERVANIPDDGSGQWRWIQLQAGDNPLGFLANAGTHQIVIRGGISNTELDELGISNDPKWVPDPSFDLKREADLQP